MIDKIQVLKPSARFREIDYKYLPENSKTQVITIKSNNEVFHFKQTNICYTFFNNGFCHLLKNIDPENKKFSLILAMGLFKGTPNITATIEIENMQSMPQTDLELGALMLHKLPDISDDFAIRDDKYENWYHHFKCTGVEIRNDNENPVVNLTYYKSHNNAAHIINSWLYIEDYQTEYHWDLLRQI